MNPEESSPTGDKPIKRMIDYAVDEITRWKDDRPARNEVTKEQLGRMA